MPDAFGNPVPGERQARQRRGRIKTVIALVGAAPLTWGVLHWTELDGLGAALAIFVAASLILRLILSINGETWASLIAWAPLFW